MDTLFYINFCFVGFKGSPPVKKCFLSGIARITIYTREAWPLIFSLLIWGKVDKRP